MCNSVPRRRTRSGRHDRRCRCQRTATTDDRSSPRKRSQGHPFDHAMSTIMPRSPRSLLNGNQPVPGIDHVDTPADAQVKALAVMHQVIDPTPGSGLPWHLKPAAVGHERVGRCCEGMLEGCSKRAVPVSVSAAQAVPEGSGSPSTTKQVQTLLQAARPPQPPDTRYSEASADPAGGRRSVRPVTGRGLGARPGSRTCSTAVTPQYTSQDRRRSVPGRRRPRLDAGGRRASGVVAASRRGQRIVAVPRSVLSTPPVRGTWNNRLRTRDRHSRAVLPHRAPPVRVRSGP